MRKTISIAVMILVLASVGCPTKRSSIPPSAFDKPTTLNVDQSTQYPDGLEVRLVKIDDSRCPPGVVCVWEGELAPTLRLRGGDLAAEGDVQLGTVRSPEGTLESYGISLRDATPTTATIVVTKQ